MKAEQVDAALRQKFMQDSERLVFWDDRDGEFGEYLVSGLPDDLGHVTVVDLGSRGGLSTKLLLEREDPTGQYLLYRSGPPLSPDEDWLLDVLAYSASFHADVASVWLHELGLSSLGLRTHLKARSTFLGNKERRRKLKGLLSPTDGPAAVDLKMMAVLAGTEVPQLFSIVRALCHDHLHQGHFDLSEEPAAVLSLQKMDLADEFWSLVRRDFGYQHETPTLAGLLRALFVTELHQQAGVVLSITAHFELPASRRQNAGICLTQWRDSTAHARSYDAAAAAVAEELNIAEQLAGLPLEALSNVFTFWDAERCVVSALKERVRAEAQAIDARSVSELVTRRRAGHWLSGPGKGEEDPTAVEHSYAALVAAAELFSLRAEHNGGFQFKAPGDLLAAYHKELYRFDQLYRAYSANASAATARGWNLLKELSTEIEALYDQGFLHRLGLEWSRLLDKGFLDQWTVPGMQPQQRFYQDVIEPYLAESDRKRAYVIISDAFRFEAAEELLGSLNGRYRMDAALEPMLGVLPSYTALGMASLLPHDRLSYSEKGEPLADGASTSGTAARDKILAKVDGMACQAAELLAMKSEDAREFTQGKRVVYIYHNVVDARGDSASTEAETFAAVSDCIRELADLVQFCVNRLNAATVWVTADHGFLFQQSAPAQTDKSAIAKKPAAALKSKKRYVIGRDLGTASEAHLGSTKVTAGTDDDMQFWVPRGANRFNFIGGSRFVHGGAMPQEVVIPLITVRQLRGTKQAASKAEKVSVTVLGTNHKITTPRYRFEVIQTEAVGDRRKPITLKAAVYDGSTPVTSVDTVVFDSASDSIAERKKSIRLDLLSGDFDKTKPYRLVLRDADTDAEVQSIPVVIDRSFESDF